MRRKTLFLGVAAAIVAMAAFMTVQADNLKDVGFTDEFPLDACTSLATSTVEGAQNRYFPLEIGRVWELSNADCVAAGECDELEEVRVSVLADTEIVDGKLIRVVEEREWVDGELEEVSRNFFAECVGTEDVYYFGEDVVDGDGNPLGGAWRAGIDGASPGIIFPGGAFLLGARYFQEVAPGVALDRAEHVEMGLELVLPAGTFSDCVLVLDTNFLEDPKGNKEGGDEKAYCPGVGIVMDEEMVLTSFVDP